MDPYCCSGGSARGWMKAGFYVVGVDNRPQPNYIGHEFHQADAIEFIKARGHEFDAILASPPCQFHSNLNAYNHKDYPDLIAPTREAIESVGVPYVIENVEAAAVALKDPIMLCGTMFAGLKVYRHRLFEAGGGFTLTAPAHPKHEALCTRNGYLPTPERPFMSIHGGKHSKAWLEAAKEAMGMPWVGRNSDVKTGIREICEAIPPAYTEHIGHQLMAHLRGDVPAPPVKTLTAVPLFEELPMAPSASAPFGAPPAWTRVVVERAGGQCECAGQCGQHKTAGRCPLRHGGRHKKRDVVLVLAPKKHGLPVHVAARLPDAELAAWCLGCLTKAEKLAAPPA